MTQRARIYEAAARWIGTPYHHQASRLGVGADCLGVLRGVWRAFYGAEPALIPPYSADWAESARRDHLLLAMQQHFTPAKTDSPEMGQVLLFRMRAGAAAKHIGICGPAGPQQSFIHAYSGHGVIESALSAPWRRRIAARFEFPKEVI